MFLELLMYCWLSAGLTAVHMHVLSARYALAECGTILAEEKFKHVKLNNPKINAALMGIPGTVDVMLNVCRAHCCAHACAQCAICPC